MSKPRYRIGELVTFIHPDDDSLVEGTIVALTVEYTAKSVMMVWSIQPRGKDDPPTVHVLDSSVLSVVRPRLEFIPGSKRNAQE